jgi:Ni,Fe-hydrogenase III large subunit
VKTPARLFRNGEVIALGEVPCPSAADFRDHLAGSCERGARLAALFGQRLGKGTVRLFGLLARDSEGQLEVLSTEVGDRYLALTPVCAQAHYFERELAEQHGIRPQDHPWLKPVRLHESRDDFFKLNGEEVHEVAVGPVHAGIIEPGHFRFQCHGERVYHLEIALGYQHRGVEKALAGGPDKRTVPYFETLAGDTTIGHTLAGCETLEALTRSSVSARAQLIRAVALELERLANHAGDLGALANDVGYLPTASYCGRIRGDILNLTALICGNRFGRGLVRPGGVLFDLDESRKEQLLERLDRVREEVAGAVELLWDSSSVRSRFENAGPISRETAIELGLVGVAARASGLDRDVRCQFPSGIYRFAQIPISTYHTGTVFARAYVRWMEIQRSLAFIFDRLSTLPDGPLRVAVGTMTPNQLAASLVEGWRGEICHVALTNAAGRLAQYKIVDPSFHNWMGLALALRDQPISDFPLCNKSFNLSYCGHDL